MKNQLECPQCKSENIYQDGNFWICPECSHEWNSFVASNKPIEEDSPLQLTKDANGHVLTSGDSVVVVKDLKIKGSSSVLKAGTKVKNIRIIDAVDDHDIACKIDGIGALNLKSSFVKKV
jgi:protein PhnA